MRMMMLALAVLLVIVFVVNEASEEFHRNWMGVLVRNGNRLVNADLANQFSVSGHCSKF